MNRKIFLQIPIVLISASVLAILLLAAWIIMVIPVMIWPSIVAEFKPVDKITEAITRRAIQSARKGKRSDFSGAPN